MAGGTADKLTNSSKNAVFGVSYFPKDNRILYTEDEGGNELNHLYVRETDGKARDLTPGQKLKAMFVGWSGDLGTFYAATNERDSRYFDLYRYDASGHQYIYNLSTLPLSINTTYLVRTHINDGTTHDVVISIVK